MPMDMRYIAWAGYQLDECSTTETTSSGCFLVIWNGTGALDTGGDWTHSGFGTEAAYAKYEGTNGLDATSFTKNSKIYFTSVSEENVDDYDILRMYINLKTWPSNADALIYFEDGNAVNLKQYLNTTNLNEWQEVLISFDSFGLTEPVSLSELTIESNKTTVGFYLDNIELVVGVTITNYVPVDKPKLSTEYLDTDYKPVLRAFTPPSECS